MNRLKQRMILQEATSLRALLLAHPRALRVIVAREVPVTCSGGTISDAARSCGRAPAALLAELQAVVDRSECQE